MTKKEVLISVIVLICLLFLTNKISDESIDMSVLGIVILVAIGFVILFLIYKSIEKWYENGGKESIIKFASDVVGIPELFYQDKTATSTNYAIGVVYKEGKVCEYYFAVSDQKLKSVSNKKFNDIPVVVCNNEVKYLSGLLAKKLPDGSIVYEECKTKFEEKHLTCAEKKIIFEIKEKFKCDDIEKLCIFTPLNPCEQCNNEIDKMREEHYSVEIYEQAFIKRVTDVVEKKGEKEVFEKLNSILIELEKYIQIQYKDETNR